MALSTSLRLVVLGLAARCIAGDNGGEQLMTVYRDVVIIGGGSAGTHAAVRLTQMGKDVTVIEKSDHLGGHANTYFDPATGTPTNIGVQVFENTSIVRDHFATLGVPLVNVPPVSVASEYVDFTAGIVAKTYTPPNATDIGLALTKYVEILAKNYSYLNDGFFLPDPVPQELLQPFGQFATEHGLEPLVALTSTYESPEETQNVPTLYQFTQLRISLATAILQSSLLTTPDTLALYRSAEHFLNAKLLLNSTAVNVTRSDSGVEVTAETPKGKFLIKAKKLLMATYPVTSALRGWDLTQEEAELFKKFAYTSYFDGVIVHPGLNATQQYTAVGTNNPFNVPELPGILGISPAIGSNGAHKVYFGSDRIISSEEAKELLQSQLDKLAANGVICAGKVEYLEWWDHTPFKMQVSVADIKDGFYRKLYGLQGKSSTYWTGAAWQGQDSSMIWAYTETLLAALSGRQGVAGML